MPDSQWNSLRQRYKDRIYAFEHRTLTESPITNAIQLLSALPAQAKVDFISHSRGGLVGEFIARSQAYGRIERGLLADPFDQTDFDILRKAPSGRGLSDADLEAFMATRNRQAAELETLGAMLKEKRPQIETFVRVGCPARGTTLASGRLDLYLSVFTNLLGHIPVFGQSDLYTVVKEFAVAVAKSRTRPQLFPGLEAQMPESSLISMLNRSDIELDSRLAVVAGDVEASGFLGTLATLATDFYYFKDHDLVVETSAMLGGSGRRKGVHYFFDKGGDVNHFNYFKNQTTAKKIVSALGAADLESAGFHALAEKDEPLQVRAATRTLGERPIVLLLPGTMGSHLQAGRNRVWLDFLDIARGKLKDLKYGRKTVVPDGVVSRYYRDLEMFLERTHDVVLFDYDWRLPVLEEGRRLGRKLDGLLKSTDQPISIVAHSMGGLIARAMQAQMPEQWNAMTAREQSRLVMLGTPNGGSAAMAAGLLGRDSLIRKLEWVDFRHDMVELLKIITGMPGVLDLLPFDDDGKYFKANTWQAFKNAMPKGWTLPTAQDLAASDTLRTTLQGLPSSHPKISYIAGIADATPVAIEVQQADVKIIASRQGDGRVPWKTGILDPQQTWYANAEHGDLARHAPNFEAILDLIETGTTSRLPDKPPATARGVDQTFELPDEPILFPDEADIEAAAMGGAPIEPMAPSKGERAKVSITHGNLAFAEGPVLVGHYADDVLVGAEAYLDRVLDGQLSQRRSLGVYPGEIDTSEVVFNRKEGAVGAVVVGLGKFGHLSPTSLTKTLSKAFMTYALEWKARKQSRAPDDKGLSGDADDCTIHSLIIGYRDSRLKIQDSVACILDALVLANSLLSDDEQINHLRFVELYQDSAIAAADILSRLSKDARYKDLLDIRHVLKHWKGGQRRLDFRDDSDMIHRIEIGRSPRSEEANTLIYKSLNDTALAQQHLRLTDRVQVDRYISEVTAKTHSDPEIGQVLYEMMLPRDLKDVFSDGRPVQLIVDDDAAAYPWELLDDRFADAEEPISCRTQMIRQLLETHDGGGGTVVSIGGALIAGDPVSNFNPLPGAREEATLVYQLFKDAGWQNLHFPGERPSADWIRRKLYLEEHKIVHLAGHGVYEYEFDDGKDESASSKKPTPSFATGMVIGDNQFLTAAEIRSLRRVPEFVFLNCCYLGKMEASDPRSENALLLDRHRLAANLATQFIRCGAKAVIAAGWEVDDNAALAFARVFYEHMLGGDEFGDSVKWARRAARGAAMNSRSNTWGAYQCYGDPQYRLRQGPGRSRGSVEKSSYSSIEQAIVALENITGRADSMTAFDGQMRYVRQIAEIEAKVRERSDWLKDARLMVAFADAFSKAAEFERAVEYYDRAMLAETASLPVKAIEQMANLSIRMAGEFAKDRSDGAVSKAKSIINESIQKLELLIRISPVAGGGQLLDNDGKPLKGTSERHSLMGSAYKRKAKLYGSRRREANLRQMRDAYHNAHLIKVMTTGAVGYYEAGNAMQAGLLLDLYSGKQPRLDTKLLNAMPGLGGTTGQGKPRILEHGSDRRLRAQRTARKQKTWRTHRKRHWRLQGCLAARRGCRQPEVGDRKP